jgi:hypothetical protein
MKKNKLTRAQQMNTIRALYPDLLHRPDLLEWIRGVHYDLLSEDERRRHQASIAKDQWRLRQIAKAARRGNPKQRWMNRMMDRYPNLTRTQLLTIYRYQERTGTVVLKDDPPRR